MANIKSSKKRVKTIEIRTLRNKSYRSSMKTIIRSCVNASESEGNDLIQKAVKKIDMAVSKGILHKNAAARKKSKLMKKKVA